MCNCKKKMLRSLLSMLSSGRIAPAVKMQAVDLPKLPSLSIVPDGILIVSPDSDGHQQSSHLCSTLKRS